VPQALGHLCACGTAEGSQIHSNSQGWQIERRDAQRTRDVNGGCVTSPLEKRTTREPASPQAITVAVRSSSCHNGPDDMVHVREVLIVVDLSFSMTC
jgi:hypothetical protein